MIEIWLYHSAVIVFWKGEIKWAGEFVKKIIKTKIGRHVKRMYE